MEIGAFTFAELRAAQPSGEGIGAEQRLRDLLEEVELADRVGLDVFGVGEHHRPDFAVSAPAVVLAAAAVHTTSIRLTSAVTVLSSEDPVRVFQEFSTLDLLSAGRAEIMVGRGSFIESFPLFGYDLRDYDDLFAESCSSTRSSDIVAFSRRSAWARSATRARCGRSSSWVRRSPLPCATRSAAASPRRQRQSAAERPR
jgi:hypothetical protein